MAKTKEQKKEEVSAIVESLKVMESAALITIAKVKVKDERALRNELRSLGASLTVVKKTLLALALKELTLAGDMVQDLKGTLMLAVGSKDAVAHLKALTKFAKGREAFVLEGGFLTEQGNTRTLTKAEVVALSQLASREELLARLVGSIRSPLSGMVNVMAGNLRGLVQVLSAYQKAKAG